MQNSPVRCNNIYFSIFYIKNQQNAQKHIYFLYSLPIAKYGTPYYNILINNRGNKERKGVMIMARKINRSNLFKRAWALARAAATTKGGKAVEYFSESLKMVWADMKKETAPLKNNELKVKRWLVEKITREAEQYHTYITFARRNCFYLPLVADGYLFLTVREFLEETEKAIKVVFDSRECGVGSANGWTTWLPKSQIVKTA